MLDSLSLRIRILLFFAFLGVGSVAIIIGSLWFNYQRLNDPALLSPFIDSGLIATFGVLGLTVFVWLLFDENVAKAIERLAATLRARVHTDVTSDVDAETARYLGDLAPAAVEVTKRLSDAKYSAAEAVARRTSELEAEKAHLTRVLSDIPLGVIMVGGNDQITLYDGQSAACFDDYNPLGLGNAISDHFCTETLKKTCAKLEELDDGAALDVRLPTADHSLDFEASVRLLGDDLGYVIALKAENQGLASRPLVFDFYVTEHHASGKLAGKKLSEICYVVFDTETTGLSTETDEVIQIGAVRIVNGHKVDGEIFDLFVDPKRPIPPASTKVHGISDDMVRGAPHFDEAARKFHAFCKNAVLVAHNAPFDVAFFKRDKDSHGCDFDHPVLDTVLLSAAAFGQSMTHTLDALADRLDVEIAEEERHTALGDAIATADVLLKMLPMLEAQGVATLRDAQNEMRNHQRLLAVVNDEAG
ncbi:MAG: 3'-5' exonuclease [Pseudomonadota bacterium]